MFLSGYNTDIKVDKLNAKTISLEFFTVLILTTMLSSMIAGYYLRLRQRKDPDEFNKL